MLPLIVVVALVSGANPEPVKLAATGFQFVNIKPELATFCSEHFAQQLTLEGIRVTTPNEIATMLGFERQKELMGCSDKGTSCLAELANALGVDGLVTGTVGKFGKMYQINIKVLNAGDARPLAAHSARVKDEEELIEEYTRAAKKLAPELQRRLGRPVGPSLPMPEPPKLKTQAPQANAAPPPEAPPAAELAAEPKRSGGVKRFWWIPAAAGGALVAGGVVLFVDAQNKSSALRTGNITLEQAQAYRTSGPTEQVLAGVAVGVGVAALAAGGAMLLFGSSDAPPAQAALIPLRDGAAFSFSGVFP